MTIESISLCAFCNCNLPHTFSDLDGSIVHLDPENGVLAETAVGVCEYDRSRTEE